MATLAPTRRARSGSVLAFDFSSARTVDEDGRLHVKDCPLTKATVNGYYGWEIPGYEELKLDPKKEYMLLRDPDELKAAASRFDGQPLLDDHIPHDADNPRKMHVAGSIGSGCYFDGEYIRTPLLSVWDQKDIDAIESEEKRELSCSYAYDPVMEAGVFKGLRYDGRMVNIRPNHVALVQKGRAGRDVLVMDALPKGLKMKRKTFDRFAVSARALLANDADIDASELLELLGHVAKGEGEGADDDDTTDDPNDMGAMDAAVPEAAMSYLKGKLTDDEMSELGKCWKAPADDADPDDEGEGKEDGEGEDGPGKANDRAPRRNRVANDAAAIRNQVVAELSAWNTACEKVRPHIGTVKLAMDAVSGGAATLYKRALTAHGVDHTGVKEVVALERMVDMLPGTSRPTMAHDSAPGEASPLDGILSGAVRVSRS